MDIKDITLKHIENIRANRKSSWQGGVYESMIALEIDERGQVGEELSVEILRMNGCKIDYDPNQTDYEKGWDLMSNGLKLEVKTATIGKANPTFQHESLSPQRDFDAIVFIDVAPNDIYLTILTKKEIDWKKLHHRKNSGVYKMDWNVKQVLTNKINTTEDFYNKYLEMVEKLKK